MDRAITSLRRHQLVPFDDDACDFGQLLIAIPRKLLQLAERLGLPQACASHDDSFRALDDFAVDQRLPQFHGLAADLTELLESLRGDADRRFQIVFFDWFYEVAEDWFAL